jgi:hypothetical protein
VIGRGWYFKEKAILHMGEIELHLTHFFLVAGSASDVSHVRWWDRALPLSVAQAWVLPPLFFCVMSLTCAPPVVKCLGLVPIVLGSHFSSPSCSFCLLPSEWRLVAEQGFRPDG